MQWSDLIGHAQQREWFRTALQQGRMATSFLFVGPSGIGKRTFARLLAKTLLCAQTQPADLNPCGNCEDCAQVDASTHPDLLQLERPANKASIPIERLIGPPEKRLREGLCYDISLKPFCGRRKVAIIDDADALGIEGANCLLKTLEEPPTDSVLILVGTGLQKQLPTIRSRCQSIIFSPLLTQEIAKLVQRNGLAETEEDAMQIARLSGGNLSEARLLAEPEVREFREELLKMLSAGEFPMPQLAKQCAGMIDSVGKDGKLKRERFKLILRVAANFYRGVAFEHSVGTGQSEGQYQSWLADGRDAVLDQAIRAVSRHWNRGFEGAVDCWKRCLRAIEQVDRNANQAALLESWSADLMRLSGL